MHVAYASAPGFNHVNPGNAGKINNQDAVVVRQIKDGMIAVLCDGCGSQPHSEVGADFGANALARIVEKNLARNKRLGKLDFAHITDQITKAVGNAAAMYAGEKSGPQFVRMVEQRFLFTAIVLVVQNNQALIATFGDGVVIVDDAVDVLESPINNAPNYLGYLLYQGNDYQQTKFRKHLTFVVRPIINMVEMKKGI